MSQEIIKVLEYLGDKLGIAIDWTAENVIPYAEELFKRYVTLEIVLASIGTIIGFGLAITAIVLIIKLIKGYIKYENTQKQNLLWERFGPTGMGVAALAIAILCGMFAIPAIGCNLYDLIQWIIVPEIPFVKEIASLLGTTI
jgi:hypothetical protein